MSLRCRFIWYLVTLHVVFAASAPYGLREGDLTTRFTLTGQADMDELVAVYNEMVDSLRAACRMRAANLDAFMRGFAVVVRLPQPRRQHSDPWQLARQVGLLFQERCARARS